MPLLGAYSVSKTALLGLTRAVADQVAPLNIRVNCIAPGVIKTKFSEALWKEPSIEEAILSQVPMKRLGTPQRLRRGGLFPGVRKPRIHHGGDAAGCWRIFLQALRRARKRVRILTTTTGCYISLSFNDSFFLCLEFMCRR
uniref:Uncharacterized protein n=1 Tax=Ixodes scapularis TaxID=6945 RepID=A0A4D5RZA7_IXOSC